MKWTETTTAQTQGTITVWKSQIGIVGFNSSIKLILNHYDIAG